MRLRVAWWSCGCMAAALTLVACAPPQREPVIARVNGTAILADEVEFALQKQGQATDPIARQRLMEKLIIEELLAQQFLRSTPGSAAVDESALAAARREILARRYIADLVEHVPPPRAEEIRAYYRDHPAMYARRHAFLLRELDIAVPSAREAELRKRIAAAATVDELARWLREQELPFTATEAERTGDELASELAAQLSAMKAGEVAVAATAGGLRVIELRHVRDAPVDEPTARPQIEQRLWMERRAAAVDAEVRRLSSMAAISVLEGDTGEETDISGWDPIDRPLFTPDLSRDGTVKAEGR